ncbi:MAG: 50S ribosomal protein L3 [Candidatus Marinimicrobia bacterium]|nr:50S ribosomal protein L3 [Candidatus Neomarinimicrobiota bacterium]MBL7010623.1 50S ribosomal protein L3 [Candidatus Neomarinimicrobiota bacterium]MBL7030499.1 50S ribosomal protein L3 [Candidatus Neomarinimicrobiota bacterium]
MMRGLIGKKIGMTQVFSDSGQAIPVTVVEAGPCVVTQIKTQASDGYDAIQVGYGERKLKHSNKALNGHFEKAKTDAKRVLAEFVPVPDYEYKPGQKFGVSLFKEGEYVDVAGTTKGKGFSGVMKRHGFKGGPKTHGQREHPRSAGSIGQASDPSRVFKGMKMAGQYGNKRMTVRNLEVVSIDSEKNHILLKGAVPGAKNGIIFITK